MKGLKIIQTPVRFHPAMGGVENHVLYLSKELVRLGHKVTVVCANIPHSTLSNYDGITIKRLNSSFKVTNTDITFGLPFALFWESFDIIHTHMPTPWTCDWSIFIAKLKGKKSILTIHNDIQKLGFFSKLITDFYLNTVFNLSLLLVDKIIIVNPDWESSFSYTKHLLVRHNNKISIIPNGVDIDLFKKNEKTIPNSLLFVSILDKYHWFKGLDILIAVVEELKKEIPNIKLKIIGEGELREKYKKEVINKKLQNNIVFLGAKTQQELSKYFSEASVFILPSTDTEGFGIVLLEALSCTTPVIATDITGVAKDIMEFNAGIVIPPNDKYKLHDTILKLLMSRALATKMGVNGRRLIETKYSWNKVTNKIINIYASLL